jgi:hypothetical protein
MSPHLGTNELAQDGTRRLVKVTQLDRARLLEVRVRLEIGRDGQERGAELGGGV